MKANQILDLTQTEFLRDGAAPHLWNPAALLLYLNEAENQANIRAELIKDHDTITDGSGLPLCQISLVSGISEYMISRKIDRIISAKISTARQPLIPTTESLLDEFYPEWREETGEPSYLIDKRDYIVVVPQPVDALTLKLEVIRKPLNSLVEATISLTGANYLSFDAATKKITSDSVNFIDKGFRRGTIITVSDSASNDGSFLVKTVDQGALTVIANLTDEINSSAKIEAESIPEIPEGYHASLVDWICFLAYSKQDSDTIDMAKTQMHDARFERTFGPMPSARALENRRTPRNTRARAKEFGFS